MISHEDICQVVQSVTETILRVYAEPSPWQAPRAGESAFVAWVHITGGWDGAVEIRCSDALARKAAGVMFNVAPDSASASDVRDAVGELANMVGGNIKGLLPGPSWLSLPTVSAETALAPTPAESFREVCFRCAGETLTVRMAPRQGGLAAE